MAIPHVYQSRHGCVTAAVNTTCAIVYSSRVLVNTLCLTDDSLRGPVTITRVIVYPSCVPVSDM